ncbi:hypothetical protein MTR67_013346 [Solanum verrucosum]|uniref:Uncharacterized protein n=1 Tax=Solanum verrucosum TaxID=315347 RepID=A0AAF0QG58_SOLVR|nr:hypothetical protein MTR67_013346 [Solanum verrucosum]
MVDMSAKRSSIWDNFDIGKMVNVGFKLEYVTPSSIEEIYRKKNIPKAENKRWTYKLQLEENTYINEKGMKGQRKERGVAHHGKSKYMHQPDNLTTQVYTPIHQVEKDRKEPSHVADKEGWITPRKDCIRYGTTYATIGALYWGDVKQAMLKIDQTNIPGPDVYGSGFYKKTWGIVGEGINDAVLEFFQNGKLLKQVNETNIELIPKVDVPERPIACCNILYKCISKH